jgi:hypothetical protein
LIGGTEATATKQKPNSRRRRNSNKSILRLSDLEHAKAAVLNSLNSVDVKRIIVTPSVRRFDELFELTRPTLQPHENDQWIEFILWCRLWLFAALPDSEMRNQVLHVLQVQLDLGNIG